MSAHIYLSVSTLKVKKKILETLNDYKPVRPTIFNVKKSKSHFWKCPNGQFDCIESSVFTSKGLHQWETTVIKAVIFYWLEDVFPSQWKTVLVMIVYIFYAYTESQLWIHIGTSAQKPEGVVGLNQSLFFI